MPIALDLDWQSPRGCPSSDHVRSTIARLVGRPIDLRAGSPTSVRARVRPRGSGFVVDVWARNGQAEDHRTIDADRCAVLADATALVVAVGLRPMAAATALPSREPEPPPIQRPDAMNPTPATPEGSEPTPKPEPAPEPEDPPTIAAPLGGGAGPSDELPPVSPSRRLRFGLGATVGPGLGVLPGVAAELRGTAALFGRRWRLEASFMHWFPRTTDPGRIFPGAAVEANLTGGGLRACGVPTVADFEFPVCAGAELGSMRGTGRQVATPRTSRSPWMGAVLGPSLLWAPHSLFALRLSADVIAALSRPSFDVRIGESTVEVYRAPAFGGRVSFGIEIRLP